MTLVALVTCLTAIPVPAVAKPSPPPIRVATYNVCKTTCGVGQFSWQNRQAAVIRNILSADPDVLALQEVDNSADWIASRLARHGYALVQGLRDDCIDGVSCTEDSRLYIKTRRVELVVKQTPSDPVIEACRPFVNDNGELPAEPVRPTVPDEPARDDYASRREYQAARELWVQQYGPTLDAYRLAMDQYFDVMDEYRRVDEQYECSRFVGRGPVSDDGSGSTSLATIGKPSLTQSAENRNVAWAVLRDRRSAGVFLATSIHMPNEKTPQAERYRKNLAGAITGFLDRKRRQLGVGRAPTILLGDFNSYWQRQPRGVQWIFGRAGFRDAVSASRTVNEDVPTVNLTKSAPNPFPAKPFRFDSPARLDYVMFNRGQAQRYEVHLRLRNGRFDNRFRGSDHNLVLADLRLPRVKVR